jgi:hypothetical protein
MTARKGIIPKGAKISLEQNLWFEEKALAELERLPTRAWQDMLALWNWLPLAHPATRRRIIACCVELASKRGDPLPVIVAKHVICVLDPKASRASVHHDHDLAQDSLRALARHCAHNPQASLSELATATGSKKTTVRQWKARPDFQAYLDDERFQVALERMRRASLDRARREHEQRGCSAVEKACTRKGFAER